MTILPAEGAAPLVKALQDLAPLIAQHRASFDRDRHLPDEVFNVLADAGLFRLWLPKIFGGYELTPLQFMEVVEAAGELDGTIGWLVGNGGGMSRAGGYLPEETARAWFSNQRAFMTSSTGAVGRAVKVEGGYRITGRWPFGSGSHHATHFAVVVLVEENGQKASQPSCAYLERSQVKIHDNWYVSGLRATASCDFEAEDAFVPSQHLHSFLVPSGVQPGPLYQLSPIMVFPWTVAVVPLGIARQALSAFRDIAAGTTRQGTQATLRDREVIQVTMGRAMALYQAARAYLAKSLGELYEAATSGQAVDDALRASYRLSASYAAESALQVAEMLSAAVGARAISEECAIERTLRDLNAAAKHIAMSPNNYAVAARVHFGIDPAVLSL